MLFESYDQIPLFCVLNKFDWNGFMVSDPDFSITFSVKISLSVYEPLRYQHTHGWHVKRDNIR